MSVWWSYEGIMTLAVGLTAALVWFPPLRYRFWLHRGATRIDDLEGELILVFFIVPMIVSIVFLIIGMAEWASRGENRGLTILMWAGILAFSGGGMYLLLRRKPRDREAMLAELEGLLTEFERSRPHRPPSSPRPAKRREARRHKDAK